MLHFDVLTIFPQLFCDLTQVSLLGKAQAAGLISVRAHDLRDYTKDKHRKVDDTPYGGGVGMVLRPEPIVTAIERLVQSKANRRSVLLSPRGALFSQPKAREYAGLDQLLLICGRYEGVDERVTSFVDEELSIGDYILSGGEYAALIVIDAVARLVPGVVGDPASTVEESLGELGLEYPHYTRPREFRGMQVPQVLLAGDHRGIREWRRAQAKALTEKRRPDLTKKLK